MKQLLPHQMRILILNNKDEIVDDKTVIHIINGESFEKDIVIKIDYKSKKSNGLWYQLETYAYGLIPKRKLHEGLIDKGDTIEIQIPYFKIS